MVWRQMQLFFGAGVVAAVLAFPAQALPLTHSGVSARATQVSVVMTEFRFVLSRTVVPEGTVVFELVNRGHVPHDFAIAGKKSALLAPGKRGLLRVVLRRAGAYPYRCTVPGHAEAGMKGVLKVTR